MRKKPVTIADVAANLADVARKMAAEAEAERQDDTIERLGAEMARMLYEDNPQLYEYLQQAIVVRPIWTSGYDVLGTIYPTQEQADEARTAAIIHKLIQAKRSRA
jgi:hypothetical protein